MILRHSFTGLRLWSIAILIMLVITSVSYAVPPGDVNGDFQVTLADVITLANYVFKAKPFPSYVPVCTGDVNSSCRTDVVDIVYLVNYIFKSTASPQATICGWNPPVNLSPIINTSYNEDEPHLNLDLTKLFYTSDRPDGQGGWDIWYARHSGLGWQQPFSLNLNTSSDEISPSLSADEQELYFCSNRPGGFGGYDIYVSRWDSAANQWLPPANLGSNVNTSGDETGVFLTQDSARIYFRSMGWGNSAGALYYSDWLGCEWGLPTDLGPNINKTGTETSPATSPGGTKLYFERNSGIHFSSSKFTGQPDEQGCGWNWPARFCLPSNMLEPKDMLSPFIAGDYCHLMYFSSSRGGGRGLLDIWSADSSFEYVYGNECLAAGWFYDRNAQMSPDGSQIVFEGGGNCNNPTGIYLMNSDGSNRRLLFYGLRAFTPAWSPDCEWIVFSNNFLLYKIKANGDSLTQLTFTEEAMYPDWSPDGNLIAYHDHLGSEHGLFLIDKDGKNKRKVNNSFNPDWSSDGERLLVVSGAYTISIVDTLGNFLKNIQVPGFIDSPRWNPDETKVIYTYDPLGPPQTAVVDTNGANFRVLTRGGGDHPSFTPDGQYIVYSEGRVGTSGIWIMDSDGCNQRPITTCEDRCPPSLESDSSQSDASKAK